MYKYMYSQQIKKAKKSTQAVIEHFFINRQRSRSLRLCFIHFSFFSYLAALFRLLTIDCIIETYE